jgi:WD40 repeat protein
MRTVQAHDRNVWDVAFTPDSQFLVSSSFDKTIKIWRVADGALVRTLTGHKEAVVGIAISPDGQRIASCGDDSTIRLWRVSDGKLLRTISGDFGHQDKVAFSSDGQFLASGGHEKGTVGEIWKKITGGSGKRDPTVRIWRVADGKLVQALADHADDAPHVAFSPDGQWLVTTSDDKTAKLYRLTMR